MSETINFSTAGLFSLAYQDAGRVLNGSNTGNVNYTLTLQQGASAAILSYSKTTTSGEPFTSETTPPFAVATPGAYTLTFTAVSNPNGNVDSTAYIDNVAVAPEPSTWALLGVGVAGLLGLTLRRRFCLG